MSQDPHSQFEDPALKAALRGALSGERAPAGLRARVANALAVEAARPLKAPRGFDWKRSPLVGLAAAALLIVGVGLIVYQAMPGLLGGGEEFVVSDVFYRDMVDTHKRTLVDGTYHTIDAPKDDLQQIRKSLKDKLGHPVLVASLGPEWKLEGAGVSTVGTTAAAQVVYSRGNETISVFSFNPKAYYASGPEGTEYRKTMDGHPIAGVLKGRTIHCIVGSKGSKLTEKELARLRDSISKEISSISQPAAGGCGGDREPMEARVARM